MAQPPSETYLKQLFQRIDRNGDDTLPASELQEVLSNGTWAPFSILTIEALIRSGNINFTEFCNLWRFINSWQVFFRAYDKDQSGYIDFYELKQALFDSGFCVSNQMIQFMMFKFDRKKQQRIYFDDFIHMCVILQKTKREFTALDTDHDGQIQVDFHTFIFRMFTIIG